MCNAHKHNQNDYFFLPLSTQTDAMSEANNRKLLESKEKKNTLNILCWMHFYVNYRKTEIDRFIGIDCWSYKKNTIKCYAEIRSNEHLYFTGKNLVSSCKTTFYFSFEFNQKKTAMQIYLKKLLIVSQNISWINHFKFNGEIMWKNRVVTWTKTNL